MTRHHRRAHRLIWPILALLVAVLFTAALMLRPPPKAIASFDATSEAA